MASTAYMEIIFPNKVIRLVLGQSIDDVLAILGGMDVDEGDDPEMDRVYLRLLGHGAELMFKDSKLATVFLYLAEGPADLGNFEGSTDTLSRNVLSDLDEASFSAALERQGFYPLAKQYPFAIDLLNDDFCIRLETRNGQAMVVIDNGEQIRGDVARQTSEKIATTIADTHCGAFHKSLTQDLKGKTTGILMSEPSVDLVKAVVDNLWHDGEPWSELSMVIAINADGEASTSYGYGFDGDGPAIAMSTDTYDIRPAVRAYLASVYQQGDAWPVKIMVQYHRITGQYRVLFEDHDEDRWSVSPSNIGTIRETFRPKFD